MASLTFALTGAMGSGKSTALERFKKQGASVFDCDKIANALIRDDRTLLKGLVKIFGPKIFNKSGVLDKGKIAQIVFSNPKSRKKLESLMHPKILKDLKSLLEADKNPVRVVEAALLFEKHLENNYDAAIAVRSRATRRYARLRSKGFSSEQIRDRELSQMPQKIKCAKADFILDNTSSYRNLETQIKILYLAARQVVQGRS